MSVLLDFADPPKTQKTAPTALSEEKFVWVVSPIFYVPYPAQNTRSRPAVQTEKGDRDESSHSVNSHWCVRWRLYLVGFFQSCGSVKSHSLCEGFSDASIARRGFAPHHSAGCSRTQGDDYVCRA